MRTVRNVILFVLIVLLAVVILRSGLERAEKAECVGWIEMSQVYPDFHLADWQAEQCKALGFDVSQIPTKGN